MRFRRLTREHRLKIKSAKQAATRRPWTHGSGSQAVHILRDARSLLKTCSVLGVNFPRLVQRMHRKHGGTVNILIEGCGMSTVGEELVRRAKSQGIKVKIVKTDIYSKSQFKKLAREESQRIVRAEAQRIAVEEEIQRGAPGIHPIKDSRSGVEHVDSTSYRRLTPEELYKLGRNKFDLVISMSGGLTYTQLPKVLGLKSVWHVLRPEGEAHIHTETVSFGVDDGRTNDKTRFVSGCAIELEHLKELTPEGEFLNNTQGLHYETIGDEPSYLNHTRGLHYEGPEGSAEHILRIRKGAKFEPFFPHGEPEFVPRDRYHVKHWKEAQKHKTVFHLMDRPPIPMSAKEFENLRGHARTIEDTGLNMGRPSTAEKSHFAPDKDLILRNGRYFIVEVDEFGLLGKILWREKKAGK